MRTITTIIIGIILFFFPILFTGIEKSVDKKRHLIYKAIEVEYEELQKL